VIAETFRGNVYSVDSLSLKNLNLENFLNFVVPYKYKEYRV